MQLARVLEVLPLSKQPRPLRVRTLHHDGTPGDSEVVALDAVGAAAGDVVLLRKEDDAKWRVVDVVTSLDIIAREQTAHGTDHGRVV